MRTLHLAMACVLAVGCGRTGLAQSSGVDAGAIVTGPTSQWIYVHECRALSDFFLVEEGPEGCVIATFADRFPPGEGAEWLERADVTRGPAPCPEPPATAPGYPEARTSLDVRVRLRDGVYRAHLVGRFPDGAALDLDFASADRRSCCGCWGRNWPAPSP